MDRYCLNCGRKLEDFEMGTGPGCMGCVCCTKICRNCGREIFDQDIVYNEFGEYCVYCVDEAEQKALEDREDWALDDDDDDDYDDDYDDDDEDEEYDDE